MATVTHYIYSHYDPPKRKDAEDEQLVAEDVEEDAQDPWLTESTFGVNRRLKNAPRFVPAIVSYDEVNNMIGGASSAIPSEEPPPPSAQVSSWYRSLTRATSAPVIGPQASPPPSVSPSPPPDTPPVEPPERQTRTPPVAGPSRSPRPSSRPIPSSAALGVGPSSHRLIAPLPRNKNNWFITNAIRSEPSSSRSTPTPTLADIFTREPPPEPKDQPFVPPVFLHIGPSNKGFAMLQQRGWSEGEALGASAPRRTLTQKALEKRPARTILDDRPLSIKMEEREVALGEDDEVREVRKVEVVDLTLSDSDEDLEKDTAPHTASEFHKAVPSHNPNALLTPIATVLKSDRLGIGLKAKTVGPFKESKKRVTHNQAALAAHVRATEEIRMRKALLGRGSKSFARIAKAEAESRKRLLAHLNAD
ncbi:hypothetical protein L226DRAFT_535790 [Lentinus tigrinus ALCF2SS1-7]|uniref:G-patch domain-containing protein n=1 Tax=Lentinus tigrinus ALCF2SS1-6 TaxID=1328759 RepID=A0A5C2RUI7_9APHY|nr:hypothetical protein L227DRAFT_580316 [Lentinus tigrinus ALCF2SS1-6]RPD73865.1 hypothetical protein L226DRAFT_535790 [Lentinus tigrinus ALCF2SS1-7]